MLGNVQFTSFSYFYFSVLLFLEILSSNTKLVVVMFDAKIANYDYTDIAWHANIRQKRCKS